MDKLLIYFQTNKDAIIAIGVLLTFIISIFSLYFSWRNNKALHYVNAVTKNRVDWIYKLRDLIAEYIAITSMDHYRYLIHDQVELSKHFEKVKMLTSLYNLANIKAVLYWERII